MPAWMRRGLWAVLLGSALGSPTRADVLSAGGGAWNLWSSGAGSPATVWSSGTASAAPVSAPATTAPPVNPAAGMITPPAPSGSSTPDAFLNFGNGAYAESGTLTTGTIQPWYQSGTVSQVFGGTPSAQQQADFTNLVLKDVQQTFQLSGINAHLTTDPTAHAAHTLSVVSGATYAGNANAIGITDVGGSGFGFIDKLTSAQTVDQLAWAVAHNVSHELMHAFGVATHHDQTGTYLDSATATWDMLTNPNTTFSKAAAQDIVTQMAQSPTSSTFNPGTQLLNPDGHPRGCQCPLCKQGYQLQLGASSAPVPEPATWAAWGLVLAGAAAHRARRRAA